MYLINYLYFYSAKMHSLDKNVNKDISYITKK